jgi:hypothetical protein
MLHKNQNKNIKLEAIGIASYSMLIATPVDSHGKQTKEKAMEVSS